MWIGACSSKVSLFFTIVPFLVRWGLSSASIKTFDGKVTFLSTMEANFGSLFTRGWGYIRDQYRRVMYTCFGAPVEIMTSGGVCVAFCVPSDLSTFLFPMT
jgi:hypothetical protein